MDEKQIIARNITVSQEELEEFEREEEYEDEYEEDEIDYDEFDSYYDDDDR